MNAPLVRRPASPYARRLARERGVALETLAGSGPRGRVVAADVQAALAVVQPAAVPTAPPAAVTPAAPAAAMAPARAFGAFSATIGLGALHELIAAASIEVPIEAFLAKAAGRAAGERGRVLRLVGEDGGAVPLEAPAGLAPSEIARRVAAAAAGGVEAARPLVLSRLRLTGVRPVAGSLPADCDLRILVVAADDSATAEALLVHDAAVVGEAEAARILADFRDGLENPLRLLV